MRGANQACGERVSTAKLTAALVREIRREFRRWDPRCGAAALARRHGVSRDTIARIIARKSWRHVT